MGRNFVKSAGAALALLLSGIAGGLYGQGDVRINIVPKPSRVEVLKTAFSPGGATAVWLDPAAQLCPEYVSGLLVEAGIVPEFVSSAKKAGVVLRIASGGFDNDEAYRLEVAAPAARRGIVATARHGKGLRYALQTLRQLPVRTGTGKVSLPGCVITDSPAFPWRAFMLDESRHFCGTFLVRTLLDEMARLKMNVFHWHLVDDPGWRIEIKKYPRLTTVGSKRDFSNRELSPEQWDERFPQRSYYTQEEIADIVRYASVRGIDVVPEIEMPGHASASIYAYPKLGATSKRSAEPIWGDIYDVTDPEVEKFLQDVLDEVIALFPSKIVHIGGDEVDYTHWKNSQEIVTFMGKNGISTFADLQIWSINRFSRYLTSKGCTMMGWNEITGDNVRGEAHFTAGQSERLAPGTIVHFWDGNTSLANSAIDKGYKIVNSYRFFTYLDYPYEMIPLEKAYSFDPVPEGIAPEDRDKVLGLGCQMWGEFRPNSVKLFYQTFPRLAAYAECGWTPAADKNYDDFRARFVRLEEIWKMKGLLGPQLHKY
jgi:hexosaminidase